MTQPQTTPAVHMIAFKGHQDAENFLGEMTGLIETLRPGEGHLISMVSVVDSIPAFKEKLRESADLVIVSAHGEPYKRGVPFVPWVGDDCQNWMPLSELGSPPRTRIGARAGIFWDVCNAGRPPFLDALAPFLRHRIVHIGVIGPIYYANSVSIGTELLTALLTPGGMRLAARDVEAAADRAVAAADCRAHRKWIGKEEQS